MDSLPVLVLEDIAQYLSNQELAACCASSIRWREAFDQDTFWKPRCDKMIADNLRVTECEVEPGFVSPEEEGNTLRPISEWRMCFMREAHLWRNWRQRRSVEQKIEVKHVETFCFLTETHVLIKSKVKAEVWDVSKTPKCLGDVFTSIESNGKCYLFEAFDDNKFVVLQGITLYIYEISSPIANPWKLIYSFTLSKLEYELTHNLKKALVTGNILVIFSITGSVFSFDMNSKILSQFQIPHSRIINNGYYIDEIVQSESKSIEFGVVMVFDSAECYPEDDDEYEYEDLGLKTGFYIFIYSARHKNFLNFRKHVSCCNEEFGYFRCILNDNYLVTVRDGFFEITDFHTDKVLVDIGVGYTFFHYMDDFSGICQSENPLTDIPPISMIMDNDIDSTFRSAFSRSLGIRTYTRRMFLQHVCKYLEKQGCINLYLMSGWHSHPAGRKKCNQVYTCLIDSDLKLSKFW